MVARAADEVLANARHIHGITQLEDVEHAVLECNGEISIIPRRNARKEA